MKFYTCVSKEYISLTPLYEFCIKRVYPEAEVIVRKESHYPSCIRFLHEVKADYVHVTDADILILPHEKTHEEYYSQFELNGVSCVRGATEGGGKSWAGEKARICGGHVGFRPEFYEKTVDARNEYLTGAIEGYREFDEVMLARLVKEAGHPIPEKPYTFHDGTPWDWEYRDLHLNDFASMKFMKWKPPRDKLLELFNDPGFDRLLEGLDSYWRTLIGIARNYAQS